MIIRRETGCGVLWELPEISLQCFYKSKTVQKKKFIKKREREKTSSLALLGQSTTGRVNRARSSEDRKERQVKQAAALFQNKIP